MSDLDKLEAKVHKIGELISKLRGENQTLRKTLEFARLKVEELLSRLERKGK